jgi:DNA mismatch repair protein MutS
MSAGDSAAEAAPRPYNRDTPAMRQYDRFKREHPGCLLLFRMGDFYELFDEDAVVAHRALGITLTERTKGQPMAGVPFHSVEGYLRRLVEQGHRVAVCEQLQDPAEAKGVVERGVTRVISPGTLVDETLLDDARPNRIVAACPAGAAMGVAAIELSTGEFTVEECDPAALPDALARLAPSELLVPDPAPGAEAHPWVAAALGAFPCPSVTGPAWMFRGQDAAMLLKEHFGVRTLEAFDLRDGDACVAAGGALLRHLLDAQRGLGTEPGAPAPSGRPLAHLRPPRRGGAAAHLVLDATTLRSLEVERTLRSGGTEGTLLSVIQRARTPMGRRLLREWTCAPLGERAAIRARQDAVAALVEDERMREELRAACDGVQDVARIAGRMALGRATPRDLVALGRSMALAPRIAAALGDASAFAEARRALAAAAEGVSALTARIQATCVDQPPAHLRDGGLVRDGADAMVDECRSLQRDATEWMAAYQARLAGESGIPSLKIGYNRVFGYYIEVTNAHSSKVPAAFTRRQTLRNAERYVTPELKEFEDKVLSAESRAIARERAIFEELCAEAGTSLGALGRFADAVADLDAVGSLAETAARLRWTRPEVVDAPVLSVEGGRHPVLDVILRERFVPNDVELATAGQPATLALITGPNMAGKSTYIRQSALIVMLAHMGSFVPADRATVGIADRVFTRIGASDELHSGQSTFMVEMTETARILNHATRRSFVALDEIGRGTSTLDGLSLAWAITEHLAASGARTLFATHYHELTDLAARMPAVRNLHVAVREWKGDVVFLHRILPGATDRSYGIHVAQLAGVPRSVVARAQEVLGTLEVQTAPRARGARGRAAASEAMPLFAAPGDAPPPEGPHA